MLVGRLAGGETGATEIRDEAGRSWVLKWEHDLATRARRREGVALAERLRVEAGWPAPRQEVVEDDDWTFVVQELRPGEPVTRLSHPLVDELLRLHELRLGLARSGDRDHWADDLLTTLTVGGQGYCLHGPLRTHDARTRALVARIEQIGHGLDPDALPAADLVHWDLHPGNLLQQRGRLSGVVDLDFVLVGDAAFDLVTLAMTSVAVEADPGVRSRLLAVALDDLDPARRGAYVGHLLVRFLDWPIRRGRWDEVEMWLGQADRLLDGC
ncbi:phosphotransferase [Iamia majanohamensis]|uniref:Phosphotransferase n=1 Tax=Iamia majanohamensis TaxID=467976 RepID=A0AAE9YDJ2_9ACTN|nr:phosphotransferase [Iamia majanohamensis]WCO69193.1 phosphotransferase [Iamia majanohamensis]